MSGFDPSGYLADTAWILPELTLTLLGFVLLALGVFLPEERRRAAGWVALLGLLVAAVFVVAAFPGVPLPGPKADLSKPVGAFPDAAGHPSLLFDGFSLVLKLIVLVGGFLCVLMAMRHIEQDSGHTAEFYAILCFAIIGMMVLASGNDFATLYIGLETMAISSYVLVGFAKREPRSNEAALKYFLLGAFASGILLYGVSLVFGATGSFNLDGIAQAIAEGIRGPREMLLLGAVLVLVGMSFKIAAVPFHMWTPDAYEGAPTSVTAFVATAAKAAAFAMMFRVFLEGFAGLARDWIPLVALLSAASMTLGNVTAMLQDNVKRMLAYSSIAHAGYILMGVVAAGSAAGDAQVRAYATTAVVLYLLVYTFTTVGAFGLVALLRRRDAAGETVDEFRGLAKTRPVAALAMLVFLLSLAGIPCTAGFIGKWWLFGSAIRTEFTWLAVLAVLNSALSLYYYARIVAAMYMGAPDEGVAALPAARGLVVALGLALVFTLWIGIYPQPFIRFAQFALFPLAGP